MSTTQPVQRVTIIGAGNMGRGIGTRVVRGGHALTVVDRSHESAEALAAELRALAAAQGTGATVRAVPFDPAAVAGDVVVFATYYADSLDLAARLRERLAGAVVVDISNPLNPTFDGLVTRPGTSAAEEIRDRLAPGTRLVKAFNTTFAGPLAAGAVAGQPLDVLIAGDDDGAKRAVAALVEGGGLRAIDAGALTRSRELEAVGLLGITLQGALGTGFQSAWKLVA
jgi:hypothetical protein